MITVTASATPAYASTLDVPGRSEPTLELQPADEAQVLLDNDAYLLTRILYGNILFRYYHITTNVDFTWAFGGTSASIVGRTSLHVTCTADCAVTLENTGATAGLRMQIRTGSSAYTLAIKNAAGDTLKNSAQGILREFVFDGTDWILWSNE